ncbi:aryl-alcohol dehydrogenase [Heliocybe sulcata]|uniref:Aryl-alcohol dehydrogenase n=1 Tax=Heliocybe sulcata TaxID=5364 RepID=A0A5C3MP15_9AGAM|nr:aryl-alcohol dehydrogenase [Heliocybe sulcata]
MSNTTTPSKMMPYVRLGKSGLKVSRVILGTMQYGHKGWAEWNIDDEEEVTRHVKFAYDHGINTFDTANTYSNGLSEILLGKAIKKLALPRDEVVILTKVYFPCAKDHSVHLKHLDKPDQQGLLNQYGLSRKHIFDSVKHSLERLQLDYIDVLQCNSTGHRFDYNTPIEETMQALHDVVQAGYVRYIGMSSCYAYQYYAIQHKLTPFISMQNHYNLLYREEEREMFPALKMYGVGSIPWSPIARGLLTRPLDKKTTRGSTDWYIERYLEGPGTPDVIKCVEEVAKKKNVSMAQVSIAWLLSKEGVTAPIVGTTNLANMEDIINAVHLKLTPEEIEMLEKAYRNRSVSGHN